MSRTLRALVAGLGALIAIGSFAPAVSAQGSSVADGFARLNVSLALGRFGTGFRIASTPTASYHLTNAHVVGSHTTVTVIKQYPTGRKMQGTVVAVGQKRVVETADGSHQHVKFAAENVRWYLDHRQPAP